jgi:hypothetical protein
MWSENHPSLFSSPLRGKGWVRENSQSEITHGRSSILDTASTILISIFALYLIIKLFGFLGKLGIKQITPKELDQKRGMMLLDVRPGKEYEQGHIPGAVHVPLADIGRKSKVKRTKISWSTAGAATRASGPSSA